MKHIKLNVLPQNQGTTPVDPENALGKRAELDLIQAIELGNLPNDPPSQPGPEMDGKLMVVMGEGEGKEDGRRGSGRRG